MGPMTGAPRSHSTPSRVPATSPTTGAGTTCASRRGQSTPIASVVAAMATALTLTPLNASGTARSAPSGPPGAMGLPRKGNI